MLKDWKLESLSAVITARMRKRIIRKYLELHIGFYDLDEHTPGSLLTKLSIDTTQLSALILPIFGSLFSTAGSLLLSITLSLCYDWRLALITLCFVPFNIFFTVYKGYFRQQGSNGNKNVEVEAGSILSECVTSTKTIYSFNFQKPAINLYKGILKKETSSVLGKALIAALFIALGAFVNYACYATIYKASIKFIKDQTLNFSDMNITINVLLTISGIAQNLLALADFPKAKDSFRSIYSILNIPSEINTFEEVNTGKITAENLKGKIEFKNVYFAYPTKPQTLILNNISFVIESGKSAALVGFSGCGKSTIIQLLERYYDPVSGQVLIDDINIKEYNLFELRKKIGLVNQEPTLFKRSIYENILYGRLDANESEVFEVAQKAVITKFFKDGHMGDKDEPLSGGEKQRVAIARAFLKNPVILLLDEATSALDKESEVEVQKSLSLLQKGRTSVTIAHRLNTIIDSDIIFVLKSGKIIEKGTHKELIAKKGKYYSLYNSN